MVIASGLGMKDLKYDIAMKALPVFVLKSEILSAGFSSKKRKLVRNDKPN